MKKAICRIWILLLFLTAFQNLSAQQRRPIDNEHPLWLVHIDVWYAADPQKIIDLIPDDIKPYVCMNLSLSCQYDKEKNVYKMPQQAVRTYKSWGTVCQKNGVWFTCQPASGGHTHIQDDDIETFEYFFKHFPNFLGWNYAEQFWGFDEAGDKSSSSQKTRWALFAKLVEMSHKYGGFLTVSFCGNIWSHPLNPIGQMKQNKDLLEACRKYPDAMLWLYKYTTSSCFYNNESVTISPFISGLALNYGVRYDNCGWNGAIDDLVGQNKCKYPASAGIGTVMEQSGINGGAVWDGPELTWREECFHETNRSTVDGYQRRNWERFPNFNGVWSDMFRKIIDGTIRIPSRAEVVGRTKIVVINDITSGNDEQKYASWGTLYDNLYKQNDPFNRGNGQWMNNYCYFKKTGRYATIPICIELNDDLAKSIPVQVSKSKYTQRWTSERKKVEDFNSQYPEISSGDLFVARIGNQLVTYTPYTYLNTKTRAEASIPFEYNTCDTLHLNYGKLSSGVVREYADHIDFYLNNYRSDTTTAVKDIITIKGATSEPAYEMKRRNNSTCTISSEWDTDNGAYTLTVNHMGPVDITLRCSGKNSRENTAAAIMPLPIPTQPAKYHGPIIIEAEDMDYLNIKALTTSPYNQYPNVIGHSGNGFVDMGSNKSGSLRHNLTLDEGGDYRIAIRYTNSTKQDNFKVTINGEPKLVVFEKTATNEWKKALVTTTLKNGSNDLRISNINGMPIYIDQIIYTPADVEDERYEVVIRDVAHGSLTPNMTEAGEGETVKLQVTAEEGYQLTEIMVVNSVYYTMAKTIAVTPGEDEITFTMPDDNVTLLPVFTDTSSKLKLDFTNTLSGTIPPGWRCVQEDNEVHEYPNNYSLGARTFSGFTGYQGKALYWREKCAEYGRQSKYRLPLEPGTYNLTFAMAAWKGAPNYKVSILNASTNEAIATSETYPSAPNANGNTSANLSSAIEHEMSFSVTEAADYVISFTNETNSANFDEFLLVDCNLRMTSSSGFAEMRSDVATEGIWDVSGRKQPAISRGLNIVRTSDGKTKKIFVK